MAERAASAPSRDEILRDLRDKAQEVVRGSAALETATPPTLPTPPRPPGPDATRDEVEVYKRARDLEAAVYKRARGLYLSRVERLESEMAERESEITKLESALAETVQPPPEDPLEGGPFAEAVERRTQYELSVAEDDLARRTLAYWTGAATQHLEAADRSFADAYSPAKLAKRVRAPFMLPDTSTAEREAHLSFAALGLAVNDVLRTQWPIPKAEGEEHARRVLLVARLLTDGDLVWRERRWNDGTLPRAMVLYDLEGEHRLCFWALVERALNELDPKAEEHENNGAEREVVLARGVESGADDDDEPGSLAVAGAKHGKDFSWVRVGGKRYDFQRPQQRAVIRALWDARKQGGEGAGVSTYQLGEAAGSGADTFKVGDVFRGHEALGAILRPTGKSSYALFLDGGDGE